MAKLPFAVMLVSGALFSAPSCATRSHPLEVHPLRVEVRPASGEEVALLVKVGDGLQLSARAQGLGTKDRRLLEFTAPGSLDIVGSEGDLELSAADTTQRFVMTVKREVAGVTRELLETQGQWAIIRMRDGKMKVETESMTMREVRTP